MIESAPGFLVALLLVLLPVLPAALPLLSGRPEKPAAWEERDRELPGLVGLLVLPALELAMANARD
jgi:hypothetical protein